MKELKNDVGPEVVRAANNLVLLLLPVDMTLGLFLMFSLDLGGVFAFPSYLPWWLAGLLLGSGFVASAAGTFRWILPMGHRPFSPAVVMLTDEGMECDLPPLPSFGKAGPERHVTIPWSAVQRITGPGAIQTGSLRYQPVAPIRSRGGQEPRFAHLTLTGENCHMVQEAWAKWKQGQALK